MNSEFKFLATMAMHEKHSKYDNLIIARHSLHTNQHSAHTMTQLTIDNQNNQMTNNNHQHKQRCTNENLDVVPHNNSITSRHDFRTSPTVSSSTTSSSLSNASCVTSNSSPSPSREDHINNNNNIERQDTFTTGVSVMSLKKNFVLNFHRQKSVETPTTPAETPASETCSSLTSPAEAPFGRRYAEISQFKNHPNVEWSINDNVNDASQDNNEQSDSFYDEVDTTLPEKVMDMGKEKSDDEDLLLGNDNIESNVDSSSDEGVLAEGEDETSSSDESETQSGASPSPQCDISLMERLLRSHPVWFLPGLQRGGSVHLLQGKEVGAFIVRGSSQKNTMAISVRLPKDAGPYIEHYLIQSNEGLLNLESSRFKFDSIPALVAHYSNCCDELPVQLSLPRGIREAINRQQLMSLALLGSEFWRCPSALASPDVEETSIHSSQVKSPTDTSGIGTIELTGSLRQKNNSIFSAGKSNNQKSQQMVETPSDTASSLSSFAVSGAVGGGGHSQMLSPLSIDNVFVQSPTVEFCNLKSSNNSINNLNSPASGIIGKTSTFKASQIFSTSQKALPNIDFHHNEIATSASVSSSSSTTTTTTTTHKRDENDELNSQRAASTTRPTPPNTLNLAIASSRAPAPPKRWLKPTPTTSPFVETAAATNSNFTVTTTVTFNVSKQQQHHTSEIEIPPRSHVPIISERLSPEGGESKTNSDSSLQKWEQVGGGNKSTSSFNPFKVNESIRSKRHHHRRKESSHYQESDILESPSVYCRSNLGDKISDYEDLWTPENNNSRSSLHIALEPTQKCSEASTPLAVTTPLAGNEVAIITNNNNNSPPPTFQQTTKMFYDSKRSPFYSDPVDVVPLTSQIVRREPKVNVLPSFHRYSEPPKGQFDEMVFHSSPVEMEKSFTSSIVAGSLDQLKAMSRPINNNHRLDPTWTIDSSWEFVDKNDDSSEASSKSVAVKQRTTPQNSFRQRKTCQQENVISIDSYLMNSKKSTIHKIIAKRYPEISLKVPSISNPTTTSGIPSTWQTFDSNCSNKFQRLSSYDNVEQHSIYGGNSAASEDGTLFSEPWDSSQWDSFLPTTDDSSTIHLSKCRPALSEDETIMEDSSIVSRSQMNTVHRNPIMNNQKIATVLKNHRSSIYRDREILKHPRNKNNEKNDPGERIEAYTLALAQDESSIFAKNILNFIACTRESRERMPQKVMRNIRQFMNGMKNYLVKHGEKDFASEVDKARAALKPDEFLNLDQILEGVMQQLVILPLKDHIDEILVEFYGTRGDVELIINNMKFSMDKDPTAFGVKEGVRPPSPQALSRIAMMFAKMQEADLPYEKLDFLMCAITMIFENSSDPKVDSNDVKHFACDEFLPLLAYVLSRCGFHFAEIEAEYIWGLMMPTVMQGQCGYYTTAMCSAAVCLKEFKKRYENSEGSQTSSSSLECSVLRVIIPNEYNGSIQTKTIPVRPHMTTRDVCRIIAHKSQITNPMDYGLFKLSDGEETLLMDNDCPQDIRLASSGTAKNSTLVFRRFDSKIAWPKQ